MSQGLKSAILIAVICAALGWLAYYYGSQPEPGEPVAHDLPAACADCGKAYVWPLGKQPAKCHFCKKVALFRALQCLNPQCRAFYPLKVASGQRAEDAQADLRCPKCGEQRFTTEISPNDISKP